MFFGLLIEKREDCAIYAYGGKSVDLTGRIAIYYPKVGYEIIKEPEHSKVYERHIHSLCFKYRKEFCDGVFREKICYQSH